MDGKVRSVGEHIDEQDVGRSGQLAGTKADEQDVGRSGQLVGTKSDELYGVGKQVSGFDGRLIDVQSSEVNGQSADEQSNGRVGLAGYEQTNGQFVDKSSCGQSDGERCLCSVDESNCGGTTVATVDKGKCDDTAVSMVDVGAVCVSSGSGNTTVTSSDDFETVGGASRFSGTSGGTSVACSDCAGGVSASGGNGAGGAVGVLTDNFGAVGSVGTVVDNGVGTVADSGSGTFVDNGVYDEAPDEGEFVDEYTNVPSRSSVDSIVEELSTERAVEKATLYTTLSENTVKYVFSVLYLVVGILCVSLTSYIGSYFSYIVGSFMAVIGVVQFILAIKTKEYVHTHSNKTAMSLILMALSVLIIVEKSSADTIIAVAWGFLGLFEGAHAFNHAFSRIARSERCVYYLVKGIIESVLAFLLLYDPVNHLELHIMVFGINLIFDAITTCPIIKNYLSRK